MNGIIGMAELALDWFERQRFDVVLIDMQIPVMDGVEATEAIRVREMRRSWVLARVTGEGGVAGTVLEEQERGGNAAVLDLRAALDDIGDPELLAMFHAEKARRRALELERASQPGANVVWDDCRNDFALLTGEMDRLKPMMERFVSSRTGV